MKNFIIYIEIFTLRWKVPFIEASPTAFTIMEFFFCSDPYDHDEFYIKKNLMILTHMTIMDFTRTES